MQSPLKSRPKSFQLINSEVSVLDASPETSRRRWSPEAKARIISEALVPGVNISAVARRHGSDLVEICRARRPSTKSIGAPGLRSKSKRRSLSVEPATIWGKSATHAGDARADKGLVADEPEGKADQDRREGRQSRSLVAFQMAANQGHQSAHSRRGASTA